jgi:type I restriction enzyme R subunit
MCPQFPGLAKVITCKAEYRGTLVKAFKKKDLPRLAISVDMLDTGIDVPEVVNLVFMKPVQSPIRLQQMIGRGTRCQAACDHPDWLPNGEKKRFLILDFWENNFSKDAKEAVDNTMPVLVTIFNTRLRLLETYLDAQQSPDCQQVIADLRAQIAQLPTDSFTLKRQLPELRQVWEDGFWNYLVPSKLEFLKLKVAPHLRLVPGVDVAAATFISKVERLKWLQRTGKDAGQTIQSIAEDAALLPSFVLEKPELNALVRSCNPETLQTASPADLSRLRDGLAPQMKYKQRPDTFLTLDLPDYIALSGYIMLTQSGEQVYVAEYRRRVEQRILDLAAKHPTVQTIQRGEVVDDWQLLALERTLQTELSSGDLELSPENIRKAYGLKVDSFLAFTRQVLDLDGLPDYADLVQHQFEAYITTHNFNADQIRFLRAVQSVFVQKRRLEVADLYEAPLTNFGADAVERWFSDRDVKELMEFTNQLLI